MSTAYELLRLIRAVSEEADRSLEGMITAAVCVTRAGDYASVRIGANDEATPGFYVPPGLDVQADDNLLIYRWKGYDLVLMVLQRNANVPLLVAGQNVTIEGTRIDAATFVYRGPGSPESVLYASQGSMYLRTDGGSSTTLYVKTSGDETTNTGWVAK